MRLLTPRRRPDPSAVLLRAVCHELSPPLATITALVRMLGEQPPDGPRDAAIRLAAEHAAHASAVLSQAAAAANGVPGPPEPPLPLLRVLPSAVTPVPADRLSVTASRAALAWPVRPRPVRQVLLNLLGNAVRHGAPGPVRLQARVRLRRLHLTVANRGGADTADLTEALRRDCPPPGEKGLGIWVVRHVVAGCGGTISARALGADGVAVEVRLPRQR